jgi:chromosome segregation ATPase
MNKTKADVTEQLNNFTLQRDVLIEEFHNLAQHLIRLSNHIKQAKAELEEYQRLEAEALQDLKDLEADRTEWDNSDWVSLQELHDRQ